MVIAQPNDNFPVFIVLNERSKRSRTLHRNMLFPLGKELQCEDISQRVEVSDPNTETKYMEETSEKNLSKDSDPEIEEEEKQAYKGPVKRAKAKALEQANA